MYKTSMWSLYTLYTLYTQPSVNLWLFCVDLLYYKVLLVIAIILKLVCTIPIILVQCSSEGL